MAFHQEFGHVRQGADGAPCAETYDMWSHKCVGGFACSVPFVVAGKSSWVSVVLVLCFDAVTIISGIIMVALFLSEMSIFFQRKEEHHVEIDSTPSEEDISIYLDITFFHLSCDSAFPAIDLMLEFVWYIGLLVFVLELLSFLWAQKSILRSKTTRVTCTKRPVCILRGIHGLQREFSANKAEGGLILAAP